MRKEPISIKKLKGTYNITDNQAEPEMKPEKKAKSPIVKLGQHGLREYKRITDYLVLNTLLTEVDYNQIQIYCTKVDMWYEALQNVATQAVTNYQKTGQMNPINIMEKCEITFERFIKNYGISPNYRLKMPIAPKESDTKKDKFDKLFNYG